MSDVYTRDPRDLTEYANAQGQPHAPPPSGHALVRPTTGLAERVVGAQPVAVHRDEAKILQKLTALAAAASTDWFYRYPVRKEGGGQDWIEGPSIKLANDVARIYGNCSSEVREIDVGDAWVFYARFTDYESGFSYERAYRQRKGQASMRTKDPQRQLDIAYQIGQSKAIRNCIVNSLQTFADHAFEHARESLVNKIGKDLEGWRTRTVEGIAKMPVDLVRVERVIGRSARDWLAPHVAQVIAMMKSVHDGMADINDMFPPIVEESRSAPEGSDKPPAATGGEPAGQGAETPRATTDSSSTDQPAAGESVPSTVALAVAYQKGKEAKAGGQKKTVPREYYAAHRTRESICWAAGYDGQDMPTFKDET